MEAAFIIPCYNEKPEVLNDTVGRLKAVLNAIPDFKYEIIVVDDGSTRQKYQEFSDGNIKLVSHPINKGYGASLITGIFASRYEWIGIIDSDGTYPVEHFPELIKHADNYDMIVGKRDWGDIQLLRRGPKYLLQKVASFIADYDIPDLNSGMRLFKKSIVQSYIKLFPQRFSFTTTITMICLTNFYRVQFIDIPYYKRVGAASSISPIKDTIRFFSLVFRLGLYFKPLRFFIPLSAATLTLAIARGIRDVFIADHIGGLSLVLFFMAFQIFFFGLIAEIINKK